MFFHLIERTITSGRGEAARHTQEEAKGMDRLRACLKAASLVCILPTAAAAEDWYPSLCLGPDVCARVDAISWAEPVDGGGPRLVVSAEGATATVRRAFVTLEAADTSMHVCMRYDPFGDLEVTCLMVPHLGY